MDDSHSIPKGLAEEEQRDSRNKTTMLGNNFLDYSKRVVANYLERR